VRKLKHSGGQGSEIPGKTLTKQPALHHIWTLARGYRSVQGFIKISKNYAEKIINAQAIEIRIIKIIFLP
jgi:hypothetical protein